MPWNPGDALRHTRRAVTPKARRQWAHVANSALARGEDEGTAVKEANGVIAKRYPHPHHVEFSADEERAMRHARRANHEALKEEHKRRRHAHHDHHLRHSAHVGRHFQADDEEFEANPAYEAGEKAHEAGKARHRAGKREHVR